MIDRKQLEPPKAGPWIGVLSSTRSSDGSSSDWQFKYYENGVAADITKVNRPLDHPSMPSDDVEANAKLGLATRLEMLASQLRREVKSRLG